MLQSVIADPLVVYAREILALGRQQMARIRPRRYSLPFVTVDIACADARYAEACERALAKVASEDAPTTSQLRLCVGDAASLGCPPPRSWWEPTYAAVDFERRLEAAGLGGAYWHEGRMWTVFDPATCEGVQLMAHADGWPPWELASPLRLFLAWSHLGGGRRLVHAATLGRGGRGVLIAGQGGAGKSGTTLAGIAAGLDTAGDDYVLIDPGTQPGAIVAHPVYRIAKQDPAGLARLGLSRLAAASPPNWQGKHEFDVEAIGGGRLSALEIKAILLPRVVGGSVTRVAPASPRDAMLALAPSSVFQIPGERGLALPFFADLARRLPAFRLELGRDPAGIAAAIDALIGEAS